MAEANAETGQIADMGEARRNRVARRDDGTCSMCGRARVICSSWGRPCVYSPGSTP